MIHVGGAILLAAGVLLLLAWLGFSVALFFTEASGGGLVIALIGVAFFFFPLGLIFTVKGWRGRLVRVDHHEAGLKYVDGPDRWTVRWEHIQRVHADPDGSRLVIHAPFTPPIIIDRRYPRHLEIIRAIGQELTNRRAVAY